MEHAEELGRAIPARDILLVTNTTVGPLYAARLTATLAPRRCIELALPDGETHKTLANVSRMLDVLVANRFSRDACVVALGGGVVGDMAGFAAACYLTWALRLSRCRPHCLRRWIHRSAARPVSIIPAARI